MFSAWPKSPTETALYDSDCRLMPELINTQSTHTAYLGCLSHSSSSSSEKEKTIL